MSNKKKITRDDVNSAVGYLGNLGKTFYNEAIKPAGEAIYSNVLQPAGTKIKETWNNSKVGTAVNGVVNGIGNVFNGNNAESGTPYVGDSHVAQGGAVANPNTGYGTALEESKTETPVPEPEPTVPEPTTPEPTVPEQGGAETETKTESGTSSLPKTPYGDTPYGDYLTHLEESIEEYSSYLKKSVEDEKKFALEAADTEFDRASVDANAAYQRNLSTYGAKAEALDRMGLNGSGYSDYLQGQAYSELRNDIGLATSEKNAAYQAANKIYSQAMRDAVIYENEKMNEVKKNQAEYAESLRQEAEAKKAEVMSNAFTLVQNGASKEYIESYAESLGINLTEADIASIDGLITARDTKDNEEKRQVVTAQVITMAQSGVGAEEINAYVKASGVELGDNSVSNIVTAIQAREKAEIIASGLASGASWAYVEQVAAARGISLEGFDQDKYNEALDLSKSDQKEETDRNMALSIYDLIMSAESEAMARSLIEIAGLNPTEGQGKNLLDAYNGKPVNTGYGSGYVNEETAGKYLPDMTAEVVGSNAAGGNVNITYNNESYAVQKKTKNSISPKSSLGVALDDTYRLRNDISASAWEATNKAEVAGAVVEFGGVIYAYLQGKDGNYGWFEINVRPGAEFGKTIGNLFVKDDKEDEKGAKTGYDKVKEIFAGI